MALLDLSWGVSIKSGGPYMWSYGAYLVVLGVLLEASWVPNNRDLK